MKDYYEFLLKIKAAFNHVVPKGLSDMFDIRDIEKHLDDGTGRHYLSFEMKGCNTVSFPVDDMFNAYNKGASVTEIAEDTYNFYVQNAGGVKTVLADTDEDEEYSL